MPVRRGRWDILTALLAILVLSGCASQSRKATRDLDATHPLYGSTLCRDAKALAPMHDDIKLARSLATPGVLMLGGAPVLIPALLGNMALDAWDRLDASSVTDACNGQPTPALNILEETVLGVGFDFFGSRIGLRR